MFAVKTLIKLESLFKLCLLRTGCGVGILGPGTQGEFVIAVQALGAREGLGPEFWEYILTITQTLCCQEGEESSSIASRFEQVGCASD